MIDAALVSAGLALVEDIVQALRRHASGQMSADDARAQIQIAHDRLQANDAAADTALDAKFKGSAK